MVSAVKTACLFFLKNRLGFPLIPRHRFPRPEPGTPPGPKAARLETHLPAGTDMNVHLGMLLHVAGFAFWSSFWPREFVRRRIEPHVGFVAYRLFYVFGVIFLFGASVLYLAQKNPEAVPLWNFHGRPWFKPLLYTLMGLCTVFLCGVAPMGPSFWGLGRPPAEMRLLTTGIYRVTRHPLYVSVFFFLLAKTLVFGSSIALIWSLGLLVYNVLGVWFFENPAARSKFGAAFDGYRDGTHWLPFWSILEGEQKFVASEFPAPGCGVLLAVYLAFAFWLHDVAVYLTYELPRLGHVLRWFAGRLF